MNLSLCGILAPYREKIGKYYREHENELKGEATKLRELFHIHEPDFIRAVAIGIAFHDNFCNCAGFRVVFGEPEEKEKIYEKVVVLVIPNGYDSDFVKWRIERGLHTITTEPLRREVNFDLKLIKDIEPRLQLLLKKIGIQSFYEQVSKYLHTLKEDLDSTKIYLNEIEEDYFTTFDNLHEAIGFGILFANAKSLNIAVRYSVRDEKGVGVLILGVGNGLQKEAVNLAVSRKKRLLYTILAGRQDEKRNRNIAGLCKGVAEEA